MAETTEHAPSTKTWDGAASPGAAGPVRRFEAAWGRSRGASRPDPRDFLPEGEAERPAVLLALLRAEIGLRWEGGDRAPVESYRDRFPGLDPDSMVALIYEEFCLREEHGEAPTPPEFVDRFPALAGRLRRVFDIHDLVGSGGSAALKGSNVPDVPFPESGQTIAGFRLLQELGRGSFARVFLAEERQLADRPVALKVSRTGSREPQTLARLQHTHIVPVHSSRTDPATGLHLLCMPYFGRVTLERLLAEPGVKTAETGADVLGALDRLDPTAGPTAQAARSIFARLPYARALAWWGARMAEAMAHAHERGVLHRDVKPSNVLVTADGLPMLLDFNLARDPLAGASGASAGGTLAYMAPEHLDSLADGDDGAVDGRADVFALGVLLFEALTGRRPFDVPVGGCSVAETLRRAAEGRRGARPSIRETHPEIPAAMEAVVLKCLAGDPSRRYPDATSLAVDLQAVADDAPLACAREPFVSRVVRWGRRRRWPIALVLLLSVACAFLANAFLRAREDHHRSVRVVEALIGRGAALAASGRLDAAVEAYSAAREIGRNVPDFERRPALLGLVERARKGVEEAEKAARTIRSMEALAATADRLGPRPPGRLSGELAEIDAAIRPFVLDPHAGQPGRVAIPPGEAPARERARRQVEALLFRKALILRGDGPREAGTAPDLCAIGESIAAEAMPWRALRDRLRAPGGRLPEPDDPVTARSADACQLLGWLAEAEGRPEVALGWARRAVAIDPRMPSARAVVGRLAGADGE